MFAAGDEINNDGGNGGDGDKATATKLQTIQLTEFTHDHFWVEVMVERWVDTDQYLCINTHVEYEYEYASESKISVEPKANSNFHQF